MKPRIRKGDLVMVIAGREKGKTGRIKKVLRKEDRVIVEGLNLVRKHVRPSERYPQGGIVEMEAPIHISNVLLYCHKCGRGVRIGVKFLEDGKKVRVCKKCGEVLEGSA